MSTHYTKLGLLTDVADGAVEHGVGDITEARFATGGLGGETGVAYHRLKPGRRQPFGHVHDEADEVYIVLDGSGRVRIEDETVELAPLDAVRVAPRARRRFEAGPDGMAFIAVGPHRPGDGEMLPEFWAEGD